MNTLVVITLILGAADWGNLMEITGEDQGKAFRRFYAGG